MQINYVFIADTWVLYIHMPFTLNWKSTPPIVPRMWWLEDVETDTWETMVKRWRKKAVNIAGGRL
jgi:hypothetical protein